MSASNKYIDYGKILSYPALFTFIIGMRGGGKTYGFKKWAIKDFLKNGKQFIYLRRYKSEVQDIMTFFNDIRDEFPDVELKVNGRVFYINKKVAGYCVTLSNAMTKKSVPYPLVNKIAFDEFIIMEGALRYLDKEVIQFLEFYETVARLRDDVKVIFCGNSITQINPYFAFWKLYTSKQEIQYFKDKYILLYYHKDKQLIEEKKLTKFGKLISDTDYGNYAMENEFYMDSDEFIEINKYDCKLEICVKFKKKIIGLWFCQTNGLYYAKSKYFIAPVCLAISREDTDINFKYEGKRGYFSRLIKRIFMNNLIRYENLEIKSILYDIYNSLSL